MGMGLATAIAGPLMGRLFGGGRGQAPKPAFNSAGWSGDTAGATVAPPSAPNEPATEPEEPRTKWDKINQVMGSEVGKIGANVAGSFLSDYRSQRNSRKNFHRLKKEGLTAVEIAGGGGASGATPAQGTTLGSGPARQAQSQQSFQTEQAALDRAAAQKRAETTAGPGGRQAGISERRYEEIDLKKAPLDREKLRVDTQRLRVQIDRAKFDLKNIWEMKLAGMSSENVITALAVASQGVDIKSALQGKATPEQIQKMQNTINVIKKQTGWSGGLIGAMELGKQLIAGEGTLSRGSKKDVFQTLGTVKKEYDLFKMNNKQRKDRAFGK